MLFRSGASSLHNAGFDAFADVLPEAAEIVLQKLRVPFGVALLEDAWHHLRRVELVPGELLLEREKALLSESWAHFGRLPFEEIELLLLREMGKTISGTGMDPNVTGRFPSKGLAAETVVQRLVVLDLAQRAGGNAVGVGLADIVTERLRSKIDWEATYANALASKALVNARLPLVADSDVKALTVAMSSLIGDPTTSPRIVAMANTLDVNHIAVSEALMPAAAAAGYS